MCDLNKICQWGTQESEGIENWLHVGDCRSWVIVYRGFTTVISLNYMFKLFHNKITFINI